MRLPKSAVFFHMSFLEKPAMPNLPLALILINSRPMPAGHCSAVRLAVRLFMFLDLTRRILRKASRPKQIVKPLVAEIFILQRQINIQRFDHRHCCL